MAPLLLSSLILLVVSLTVSFTILLKFLAVTEDIRKVLLVDNKIRKLGLEFVVGVQRQRCSSGLCVADWSTDLLCWREMTGGSSDQNLSNQSVYMKHPKNMAKYQGLKTAGKRY